MPFCGHIKISNLWVSLRSANFMILFTMDPPQANLKSSIFILQYSILLPFPCDRFSQVRCIGFCGLDIFDNASIKKNQNSIRYHQDFIELGG